MSHSGIPFTITMNTTLRQFEAVVDGHEAVLEYYMEQKSIVFTHTEVPYPLRGRGIGSALAKAGLDYAAKHSLSVVPDCPFVARYIQNHPEHLNLVEPRYRKRSFGLEQ